MIQRRLEETNWLEGDLALRIAGKAMACNFLSR